MPYHRLDEIVAAGYHLLNYNEKYAFAVTQPPNERYILFKWQVDETRVQGGMWIIATKF